MKLIVRSTNVEELEKVVTIEYKAKFLDIVIINTNMTIEQVSKIKGVYSVETDDLFECFALAPSLDSNT